MYKCPDCKSDLIENRYSFECSNDICNFYMGKEKFLKKNKKDNSIKVSKEDIKNIKNLYKNKVEKMPKNERKDLQNKVHEYLDDLGIKYIIRENNQHQQKYRHKATKKYDGIPDDLIFINGNVLFFEYKIKGRELNERQIEWKEYLVNNGFRHYEIRDLEIALQILKDNGVFK